MKMQENPNQGEKMESIVYDVIRSAEVREYYKNFSLTVYEKEQIILHSYISIQKKAVMIKKLMDEACEDDKPYIEQMYQLLNKYIGDIYHPSVRTIFLLELGHIWMDDDNHFTEKEYGYEEAFDTIEEVMEYLHHYIEGNEPTRYVIVPVLQIPDNEKLRNQYFLYLNWIDQKWEIRDILVLNKDKYDILDEKNVLTRFFELSMYHPLPFENGSRLKLQTPFMEEPFYGVLWSEKDGNGCWYYFLYDEKVPENERATSDCINLTDLEIDLTSGYSSLDWIERA